MESERASMIVGQDQTPAEAKAAEEQIGRMFEDVADGSPDQPSVDELNAHRPLDETNQHQPLSEAELDRKLERLFGTPSEPPKPQPQPKAPPTEQPQATPEPDEFSADFRG